MPFTIVRNDITKMKTDAIVNPSNKYLLEGAGTSEMIFTAAGRKELTAACEGLRPIEPGTAVITKGFNLPAEYIIHVAGPVWNGTRECEEKLIDTYMEAMRLAENYKLKSIAFPLLSSGNYGFPKERALEIANFAITTFLSTTEMEVALVVYDSKAYCVSDELFHSVQAYIDDHYIEEVQSYNETAVLMEAVVDYEKSPVRSRNSKQCYGAVSRGGVPKKRSLEDLLEAKEATFQTLLFRMIDDRGLTDSQVYHKANLDRRLFSKIRSNPEYAPSKRTAVSLAVALELTLDETKDLLAKAGYALSDGQKGDIVIRYFIENKNYNILEINEILFSYNLPLLGA